MSQLVQEQQSSSRCTYPYRLEPWIARLETDLGVPASPGPAVFADIQITAKWWSRPQTGTQGQTEPHTTQADPVRGHEPDYGFQGVVDLVEPAVEFSDAAESCLDLVQVTFDRGKACQRVLISRVSWFVQGIRIHSVPARCAL